MFALQVAQKKILTGLLRSSLPENIRTVTEHKAAVCTDTANAWVSKMRGGLQEPKVILKRSASPSRKVVARYDSQGKARDSIPAHVCANPSQQAIQQAASGDKDCIYGHFWDFEDPTLHAKAEERRADRAKTSKRWGPVIKVNVDTGATMEWMSRQEAAEQNGIHPRVLKRALLGQRSNEFVEDGVRFVYHDKYPIE